jgi:UBX domain
MEEATSEAETLTEIINRVTKLLAKAVRITTDAISRSIQAGFDAPEADGEVETTVISKLLDTLQRMWKAALNPTSASTTGSDGEEPISVTDEPNTSVTTESSAEEADEIITDFGKILSKEYGVTDERNEEDITIMLGGSVGDALRVARNKARLLVAFIPAARPDNSKSTTSDHLTIRSLLSAQVSKAAEKRSRKGAETGSFVLWGARAGSTESVVAMKRLKTTKLTPKGEKRPTLVVAYPAQVVSPSGVPKIIPRLLAQHHCSPPPSPESMAAWLNVLRKRHSKQFAAMQRDLKEAELHRERQEGYKSSIESDLQRKEEEKRAAADKIAKEKAEQERLSALKKRREEILESLPEEAKENDPDTVAIALRFADGRTGQRRFDASTPLSTVFNWVDATYSLERERIRLTTMNGKKSFVWEEVGSNTLKEAGLGRMAGLRVLEKKQIQEEIDSVNNLA